MVSVLHDDELRPLQPAAHAFAVGHRRHRVAPDDPECLDLAAFQRAEQVDGRQARLRADRARRDFPERLCLRAVLREMHAALPRQTSAHVADLPAAHRVGLPRQRERPVAKLADLARGKMQITDGVDVPGAAGALVEAHRPQRHPARTTGEDFRPGDDVIRRQPGQLGHARGRVGVDDLAHVFPALRVARDERFVDPPHFDEQVQPAVEQREVRAGTQRQVQRRARGGAVRRGSTTINFAPAECIRRRRRWWRIGWHSAMFAPMTRNPSARSKSS